MNNGALAWLVQRFVIIHRLRGIAPWLTSHIGQLSLLPWAGQKISGQGGVASLCSWEGNQGSGIALDMHNRPQYIHLRAQWPLERSGWYSHLTFSSFFQAHPFSWWRHILCLVFSNRSLQVLLLSSYHCWSERPPHMCEVSSFHSFVPLCHMFQLDQLHLTTLRCRQ